jgi:hypothetical protein
MSAWGKVNWKMGLGSWVGTGGAEPVDACLQGRHGILQRLSGELLVAYGQGVEQDLAQLVGDAGLAGVGVADHAVAAAQQVRDACLVGCGVERAVGRPAVAFQRAGEVAAEDGLGVGVAAAGGDVEHGDAVADVGPQPAVVAVDAPAGLVRSDRPRGPQRVEQRGVGRLGVARDAVQRAVQSPGGHAQSAQALQDLGGLGHRHPQPDLQPAGQRLGDRSQHHSRRARGVGGLVGVAAPHPPPTVAAATQRDVVAAHSRGGGHDLFLQLLDDLVNDDRAPAPLAALARGHVDVLIDPLGWRRLAAGLGAVVGAGLASQRFRVRLGGATRERCGLALARPPRLLQPGLQPLDLLALTGVFRPQPCVGLLQFGDPFAAQAHLTGQQPHHRIVAPQTRDDPVVDLIPQRMLNPSQKTTDSSRKTRTCYTPQYRLRWSAEADGNRTRQTSRAGLIGFEDRGAHQEPRRLPVVPGECIGAVAASSQGGGRPSLSTML